ncbi:arylamine N-acetyltransferase, partial [Intestinibacter sp.]
CETHLNSPFINSMKVAIYTDEEHIRLFDGELIFYKEGKVRRLEKICDKELDNVLKKYFGIVL